MGLNSVRVDLELNREANVKNIGLELGERKSAGGAGDLCALSPCIACMYIASVSSSVLARAVVR